MRWVHRADRMQWLLLSDEDWVIGSIDDEALPPADQWDDRPALSAPVPLPRDDASPNVVEPNFPGMVPGFQSWVRSHFGLELPDEARQVKR